MSPRPPDRDLPPEVRERLRSAVVSGLDTTPRRSVRGPVAAAFAVVLLVTGGVLAARLPRHGGTAASVSTVTAAQPADARRCASALDAAGPAGTWADATTWRRVFQVSDEGRHVTALLVNGRPMFCETTLTTVTVSAPAWSAGVPADAPAAALLGSDDGVVAGVVRPGARGLVVTFHDGNGSHRRTATVADGLFVAFGPPHGVRHSTVTVSVTDVASSRPAPAAWSQPLATPAPVVFRTDRPEHGTADDPCVELSAGRGGPVLDAGGWRGGAAVGDAVVDYDSAAGALCDRQHGGTPEFSYLGPPPATGRMPLLVAYERNTDTGLVLAGLVAPDVGRVEFTTTSGAGSARLIGPTFAVALDVPGDARDVRVAVVDRSGDLIYHGALPTPVEEG